MDIVNTLQPALKLEVLSQKASEIISRLQQAGLFRAIVIEQKGSQVLLDTSFGRLSGKAPNNLHKGDEILARLTSTKPEPTLKIEQHTAKLITLNATSVKLLSSFISTQPVIARVVAQQAQGTQIKINNKIVTLPKQGSLQAGESILLKPAKNQLIEVSRINPQAILKTALSNLLPRSKANSGAYNLSAIQNISAELITARPDRLQTRLLNQVRQQASQVVPGQAKPVSTKTDQPATTNSPPAANPAIKEAVTASTTGKQLDQLPPAFNQIKQLLTLVASPMARIEGFKPESVQQLLTLFTLLKPGTLINQPGPVKTLPESLRLLMNELKNSPEAFKLLVNQVFKQTQGANKAVHSDRFIEQMSNFLRVELFQQTEQSLNQIMIQKSAIKLQVESNQPIQIHLNIPVQVENESRNIELRIKQKQRNEQESEQHWEIDLTFEFGLLGQISTHILLQEQKLSAHFWAIKPQTKNLIDNHLDQFKNQLKKSGFELGLFNCYQGSPPQPEQARPIHANDNLLDIKV